MKRVVGNAIVFLAGLATLVTASLVVAQRSALEIGIARSLLSQQTPAVQEKALEDVHSLGATWFRDVPSSGSARGVANYVEEVRRAKQNNLKFLMAVTVMDSDYDDPASLPNNGHGWKEKKLSHVNLEKYAARLRGLCEALKSANLTIDAAEFGNEYDTYAYDGDVPNGHAASSEELRDWLRGYGRFLRTGAEVVHQYFPQAKIITFGIAHSSIAWDNPPHHIEHPAKIVAMLRNVEGFNYLENTSYHVDGYATHIYPSPNAISEFVSSILREDEGALGKDKPFWITEWGFLNVKAFPNKKGQTLAQGMQEVLRTLDGLHRDVPMGPAFYYTEDSGLTDSAGKLVPFASVLATYGGVGLH